MFETKVKLGDIVLSFTTGNGKIVNVTVRSHRGDGGTLGHGSLSINEAEGLAKSLQGLVAAIKK